MCAGLGHIAVRIKSEGNEQFLEFLHDPSEDDVEELLAVLYNMYNVKFITDDYLLILRS